MGTPDRWRSGDKSPAKIAISVKRASAPWATAPARRSDQGRASDWSRLTSHAWSHVPRPAPTPQPDANPLGREAIVRADSGQIGVLARPSDDPRVELGRAREVFEGVVVPSGERLAAGEVVGAVRVVGIPLESSAHDLDCGLVVARRIRG